MCRRDFPFRGAFYLSARKCCERIPQLTNESILKMHYKNGREAKNGDKVVLLPQGYGTPVIGVLYDATAGNDFCNGKIARINSSDPCPNLKEVLHFDDLKASLPAEVPDTSK